MPATNGSEPQRGLRPPEVSAAPGDPRIRNTVIETHGLVQVYGDQRALDGIDLSVPEGSIMGVIGPSGCGKSTLVRALTGMERPTEGTVTVFGKDPAIATSRMRSRFGYMPQMPTLFPNLSASANLSFIASLYGVPWRGRRQRLRRMLDLVELTPHRRKRVSELSGGMQRRLTLAATLVHEPELLFLDEPTAGVDPVLRERFWTHFRELRDEGRTIVVPTQYVNEAVSCDTVAVMARGRLIAVQPPDRLAPLAFGGVPVLLRLRSAWFGTGDLRRLAATAGIHSASGHDEGLLVVLDERNADLVALRAAVEGMGADVGDVVLLEPTYDEIFVRLIERLAPTEVGA